MNKISKLIDAIDDLGQVVDLEEILPALITFIDTLRTALADDKLSIAESLKIASALFKVVDAAKKQP